MDASGIEPKEIVKASKKLGRDTAESLASAAKKVVVCKGKKVTVFDVASDGVSDDLLTVMLGATGNLRAPCIRTGKVILVGFNEEVYGSELGKRR